MNRRISISRLVRPDAPLPLPLPLEDAAGTVRSWTISRSFLVAVMSRNRWTATGRLPFVAGASRMLTSSQMAGPPEHLLRAPAQDPLGGPVPHGDPPVRPDGEGAIARPGQRLLESLVRDPAWAHMTRPLLRTGEEHVWPEVSQAACLSMSHGTT